MFLTLTNNDLIQNVKVKRLQRKTCKLMRLTLTNNDLIFGYFQYLKIHGKTMSRWLPHLEIYSWATSRKNSCLNKI